MLKKVAIVAATAAAGLLAVSPLAFAGESGGWSSGCCDHHSSKHHSKGHSSGDSGNQSNNVNNSRERSSGGLINVDALNGDILKNANVCPNAKVDVIKLLGVLGTGQDNENQNATCVSSNDNTSQSNKR